MEIITVKNVDEVLKVALTKPLKRVEWVDVDQISNKKKQRRIKYPLKLIQPYFKFFSIVKNVIW